MSDRRHNYGHAVENGIVRYLSPSALTVADPNQYGGCLQRYFRKYVLGHNEPFTEAQKKGVETHSQIEHYLRTGEKTLGPLAMAMAPWIPLPGPTNEIEFTLVESVRVGELDVITGAPLTAAGIPVVGYGDLLIRNAEFYIDDEGEHRPNRPNTVESIDWKTSYALSNAKKGPALADTVQMVTYGEFAARTNATPVDWARLSHVTAQTSGGIKAIKRSTVISREDLARRWELVEGVARTVIDVAGETDENKVPTNPASCSSYRGCPHHGCPEKRKKTLAGLFGATLSQEMKMGMLDMLNLPKTTEPVAPVATPEATGVALSMTDAIATLKANEATAIAARASAPPAPVPAVAQAALIPGFKAACESVIAANMGLPGMNATVAAQYAQATGIQVTSGAGLAGSGMLGQITLIDPAQMIQLSQELTPTITATASPVKEAPAGILPTDAPASKPELAAKPIEAAHARQVAEEKANDVFATPKKTEDATPAKRKAGRPKKPDEGVPTDSAPREGGEIEIYVNAFPTGGAEDLGPYVAALCQAVCKAASADDVRVAPSKDSPLAFGGWKGVLAAFAREAPPKPGRYVLIVAGEVAEAVADGLAEFVVARGVKP